MIPPFPARTLCAVLIGAGTLSACSMGPRQSTIIDGAPHSFVVSGTGPTVVFEAGIGSDLTSWAPIFESAASFSTALAYSRSGYSGKGFQFRYSEVDSDVVARRLKSLLDRRSISRPIILVGHSAGGNYSLRYAELFPHEVDAVLLVDSRPPDFQAECDRRGIGPCSPPAAIALLSPPHVSAEINGLKASERLTPEPEQLGMTPVTVMAATKPPLGVGSEVQSTWLESQRRFSDRFLNGRYVEVENAGHFIHRDAPNQVIEELRRLVNLVARSTPETQSAEAPSS